MKQELPTSETKTPTARPRLPRINHTPKMESTNGLPRSRPKPPASVEIENTQKARRPAIVSKTKTGADDVGSMRESQHGSRAVEQYPRVRRRPEMNCKGEDEMQRRLEASEILVKELQTEVSALKAEREELQRLNLELGSQNKQLVGKLSDAELKIMALGRDHQTESISQEVQSSEFSNVRKLIGNKLNYFKTNKEIVREDCNGKAQSLALVSGSTGSEFQTKIPMMMKPFPLPPPRHGAITGAPPPPPPPPPPARVIKNSSSALMELYHLVTKREGTIRASPVANKAHNSIVGELQNRSAHLIAIKADVETKGEFIKHLIEKVQNAAYMDMDDVLTFVECLDQELSTLADERAVLKHFNWPERKADALREAAVEYHDLTRIEHEASSFKDDSSLPCEAILKKIECLLDKLERSIQRLIKLRGTSMVSYRECMIPVDWMLDSGMVRKMKLACVKLAKVYMNRLSMELELFRHSDRESLLSQGVRFAYRAHQVAGGLDPETMHTFEELRQRAKVHGKGSREQIPSIRVS